MFHIAHSNINITNMQRSIEFYQKALSLSVVKDTTAQDGSFRLVFLGEPTTDFLIELTWLRDHPQPYDLGENEIHIAFRAQDFEAAHALHQQMGCICFENKAMGIYFIEDPDGYWLEIIPQR